MANTLKQPGFGRRIWLFFASVKLTVFVLLFLAVTSIIGTLVPQNGSQAFYLHKYGEVFTAVFNRLGLFDMYNAWWFLLAMMTLAVNIVVCSADRLKTTWKLIFPKAVSFQFGRFQRHPSRQSFELNRSEATVLDTARSLLGKGFGPVVEKKEQGGTAFFAEKGRRSKLGVYVVHMSILFMLSGAVIGTVWGFKAMVNIPEGETVSSVMDRDGRGAIDLGFSIRCNDFSVSFYDTGQPEEFKSNVSIIRDGKEVLTTEIIVNAPLRYEGISFYQSSYGTASAENIHLNYTSRDSGMTYTAVVSFGRSIDLPESGGRFELERYVNSYPFRGHNLGEGFLGHITGKEGSKEEVFIPSRFPTFDKMRQGRFAFAVESYDKTYYTGLQVNRDPGVWYVYVGFMLMILGCWVTFFMSHRRVCVWVAPVDENRCRVMVSGLADRNAQGMVLKVERIRDEIQQLRQPETVDSTHTGD